MANACFRCRASIPSGGTFCSSCRGKVTLEPDQPESRMWLAVAIALGLQAVFFAGGLVGYSLFTSLSTGWTLMASVMLAWLPGLLLAAAVLADASHVRDRTDTDWQPSKWGYYAVAWAGVLLVLPGTLLALYHLYRRRSTVGFPRTD